MSGSVRVPAPNPGAVRVPAPAPSGGSVRVGAPRPYVGRGSQWVGHEGGRADVRFHVEHPNAFGSYRGGFGPRHSYRLGGWDESQHRFWSGGYYFGIASWEWGYADDWNWSSDQVVIYEDPDHDGWYLAYNVRLGTYVHVQYGGNREE